MSKKKTKGPLGLLRSKLRAIKAERRASYIYGEYVRPGVL